MQKLYHHVDNSTIILFIIRGVAFPVDIGRAGFAGPWEPAMPPSRLMTHPKATHGYNQMDRQHRKCDNQSEWCLLL